MLKFKLQEMPSVVIDTNVLVSGLLTSGKPALILDMIFDRLFEIHLSQDVWEEYKIVCGRDKFSQSEAFVRKSKNIFDFFEEDGKWFKPTTSLNVSIDSSDNKFLELAVDSRADFFVTGNLKHFPKDEFQGIKIISPADFIVFFQ